MAKINPNSFYNCENLLSKRDINGDLPGTYMCVGNRTGGKTTSFNNHILTGWKDGTYREVIYLRRFKDQLQGAMNEIFPDTFINYFHKDMKVDDFKECKGGSSAYKVIKYKGKVLGYIVAINLADRIKNASALFQKVDCIFFDEFQPETGPYCSREIEKFKSIVTSVSRGVGEQVRYVPVFMVSNLVSSTNPYFIAYRLASRVDGKTKFIKGKRVVLEQNYNKSAAKAHSQSPFLSAFEDDDYYTEQGSYLHDDIVSVGKIKKKQRYICNLRFCGRYYSIWQVEQRDMLGLYCSKSFDETCPVKIAVKRSDITDDYLYVDLLTELWATLRGMFYRGRFFYEDQECKDVIYELLVYNRRS